MNWLVTVLLGNTVLAAALAIAALAASLLRRPAVAHVLWALVLIKLITPALVRVEVPGIAASSGARSESPAAEAASPRGRSVARATPPLGGAARGAVSRSAVSRDTASASSAQRQNASPSGAATQARAESRRSFTESSRVAPSSRVDVATVLLFAWLSGTLVCLGRDAVRWRHLARIRRRSEPAPAELVHLVAAMAGRIGLVRPPDVRVLPGDFSPVVLPAIGRAAMIVPASLTDRFSAEQRRAIVVHELAHLRRGDHWIRLMELLTAALMWWHPLLWLARRGLHEAEEQCCDAWVVGLLPDSRRTYADALVDVLEHAGAAAGRFAPRPIGLATGLGRMTHLRRRLTMIVDRTPPKSLSWIGRIAVVALVATLPLAPVRGGDDGSRPSAPVTATSAAAATPTSAPLDDATRKAVESLLEMAQDENQQAQMAASEAIARFGARAVPVLIEALGREKSAAAAQALLPRTGVEGIEGLIEAVGSNEAAVRERALLTLETVLGMGSNQFASAESGLPGGGFVAPGPAPETAPRPPAYAPDMAGRYAGGFVTGFPPQIVSYASWTTAPAAKASADASPAVRRAAVRVLAAVSRINADPAVVAALGTALKDPDASVRGLSAAALVNVARAAPELASALAEAVADSDQNVRIAALNALGAVGPAAKAVMPTVTAALKDPNSAVRIAAANALGSMQLPQQPTVQGNGLPTPGPTGLPEMEGAAPSPMRDNQILSLAQNIFHWTKFARYDLAKADADRLLKLQPEPRTMLFMFQQVAQERNEDLKTWTARIRDVKELKPLVDQITAASEQLGKPSQTQPANEPPGPARSTGPE